MDNQRPEDAASSGTSTSMGTGNRVGETTRMFLLHIRQYFTSLPIATLITLFVPIIIEIVDGVLTMAGVRPAFVIRYWLSLNVANVLQYWEVHRLISYPFPAPSFSLLLSNFILLIPYLAAMEKRKGTLSMCFALFLFTLVPGTAYTVSVGLLSYISILQNTQLEQYICSGLSGWTVAISCWSMLADQEAGELRDQVLFGVFQIPGHAVPVLIIAFYFFLAPDTSLVLHLFSAGTAYLYATHRIPDRLLPSHERLQRIENHRWFRRISQHSNYVSTDADAYLPISSDNVNTAPNSRT